MNTYYLRCHPDDYEDMVDLGCALGVLKRDEGVVRSADETLFTYSEIGPVSEKTGQTIMVYGVEQDEELPVLAPDGTPYFHANIYTVVDIRAMAEQSDDPAIQAALLDLDRYVKTAAPASPVQRLAGY